MEQQAPHVQRAVDQLKQGISLVEEHIAELVEARKQKRALLKDYQKSLRLLTGEKPEPKRRTPGKAKETA